MSSDAVVNLIVNADDAERTVTLQVRRIVDEAERRAPDITLHVNVDNAAVVRTLQREFSVLGNRIDRAFGQLDRRLVDLNDTLSSDLRASLQGIRDDLQRMGGAGDTITNITNHFGDLRDETDDANRSTGRLAATFRSLSGAVAGAVAGATQLVIKGGVVAQLIPVVGSLVTSIESIVPAAAAGVSAFVTMKAAALTLKLGLTGVEDAISAVFDPDADPEKIAEALDKLSDNARDFVLQLQELKPAFDKLRLDVQDRLFKGLDSTLKSVAKSTFPELRTSARGFADTFNEMARGAGAAATEIGDNGTLGKALKSSNSAFQDLERIPGQVLTAVAQLAAAGGPLLNRFTSRVADIADRASKALTRAFESGSLEDAVDGAGDTIKQLGRIAQNVFGTIGNVMAAAGDTGAGLFGTLERVTQALEDLSGTDEFQDTLGALLDVGGALADQVLPILAEAFEAVAPAIQTLAPYVEDFVELLGGKLTELIPELAPLLDQMAILFGEILEAIGPLIEEGIDLLIELMPDLIPLFEAVTELVRDLSPLLEYLVVGLAALGGPVLELAIELLTDFVYGLDAVVVAIDQVIKWVYDFAGALTNQADPGIRATTQLLNGDFKGAWDTIAVTIGDVTLRGTRHVVDFANTSAVYLSNLAVKGAAYIYSGFNNIASYILARANDSVRYIAGMRDRILSIALGMVGSLYNAGVAMISALIDGMLSQLGGAISAANRIVGAISDFFPHSPAKRGPFSGSGYPFYSGQEVVSSFARGIESKRGTAAWAIRNVLGGGALIGSTAGVNPLTGIVNDGTGFAGIANADFARLTPNVTVNIGNQALTDYVQIVVDENDAQQDRLASQGSRT